jgi:hypothetical protein
MVQGARRAIRVSAGAPKGWAPGPGAGRQAGHVGRSCQFPCGNKTGAVSTFSDHAIFADNSHTVAASALGLIKRVIG